MNKRVAAATLGCKTNSYDTESVLQAFRLAGYVVVDFSVGADVYVINTCTVTSQSDKKSRQMIRKAAKAAGTSGLVVVTGCFVQNMGDDTKGMLAEMGVHIAVGVNQRADIVRLVETYSKDGGIAGSVTQYNRSASSLLIYENMPIAGMTGKTRAFVKIQDGCDNFCSYCIIPHVRGPVRSRRLDDVERELAVLTKNGVAEIVLTGIEVASYGKDLEGAGARLGLPDVIKTAYVAGVSRIRLSSVGPRAITPEFAELFKTIPALCPHVHLSLQSGCDKTLAAMNRGYSKAEYLNAVDLIRDACGNTAAITTDVIVGFPGESDEDFAECLDFVKRVKFASLHVFPFSAREGTAAYDMQDKIPPSVISTRVKDMIALAEQLKGEFLTDNLGRRMPVLFESASKAGVCSGFTPNYIEVSVISDESLQGQVREVCLERIDGGGVMGVVEGK